ncbi:hypothetical protein F5I97DRAFT_1914174 [Phlebopus sp. FC_14]|nr:hypothetical protein F5I97DRAFT_1914174 [Phlebopus sp. FC_14]
MHSDTSKKVGSVTSGPHNNRFMSYPWTPLHAFSNVFDYLQQYHGILSEICERKKVDELLKYFPIEAHIYLIHGDLLSHNILVGGSKITAVINWETAGFYPEFWEYCRIHHPGLMMPA